MPRATATTQALSSGVSLTRRDLQEENILLALPALLIAGAIVTQLETAFQASPRITAPGLLLLAWPAVVYLARRAGYLAGAWTLVLGAAAGDLLVVGWTGIPAALHLLALPAGLAALFAGPGGGLLAGSALTLLLSVTPATALPAGPALRFTTILGIWGTVGLVWLTSRPLTATLDWAWSDYQQSRQLLEQARDYQVQLKQTLADLADANLQLTRLNRLAHGLRRAAEEARLAKEQFVANVSHELRTPLNMIVGYTEMILQAPKTYGRKLPPALLADLTVIARNSQHLSSLIDDVLDLSQIEAGQMALTRERVSLHEIVDAAAVAVRPLFESRGLYLELDVPEESTVFCDRTRIREVLLNLLSNAGRFTEQGGVRVHARRDRADYVVAVADTGPGIAAGDRERLFQPFQQLDGSLRRRYGGTGLGLAISKSFVELHGGQMWLESKEGVGSTFNFRLPVDPPAAVDAGVSRWFSPHWQYEERTHRPLVPPPVVRPRFVVLEPGDTLQRLLSRYLDGAEIAAVSTLDEAMQELARVPAQALLCNDPSLADSLERLRGAAGLPYGTPAIVCSLPALVDAADALGAADYLVKPITQERLLAALGRAGVQRGTVLVVDDEPEAQQLFWRMLAASGRDYRVLAASNGEEALDVLQAERPDAVLLDLVMPEMDGFRLLELRSQDAALRQVPVIVTSARDPAGQPIVGDALAVTRGGGLSVRQLLTCVEATSRILGTGGQDNDPALPGGPSG